MKLLKLLSLKNKKIIKKRKSRKTYKKNVFLSKIFNKNSQASTKKNKRDREIKRRKHIIPTAMLSILFWLTTLYVIFFINPLEQGSLQIFFFSISLSLFFTFSLVFSNKRRIISLTLSVVFFLTLRYFGIGNIINILLILGLVITSEIYFSKK